MKLLIKYMGLLFFSGLIMPVCRPSSVKTCATTAKRPANALSTPDKPGAINPYFYNDVIKNIFPVLKNLN